MKLEENTPSVFEASGRRMFVFALCLFAVGYASAGVVPENGVDLQRQRMFQYMQANGIPFDEDFMEDANLTTMELIAKYGFEGESHTIQTDDGYILTVHRILPKAGCSPKRTIPVILQHGLLSSSADWIIMGPNSGLGYILSSRCYDVWMGNSRGNRESKKHVRLSTDSDEYWDFSWHEMGIHDLPTLIDYVLARTGQEQLYYIGHSQGTTQYFVMDTLKPEYAKKVRLMTALAPIAYMGNSDSALLKFISHFQGALGSLLDLIGVHEFLPGSGLITSIGGELCKDEHPNTQWVCENMLFVLCGYDEAQTNGTMLPILLAHTPAGSGTRQFLHYAQLMNSGNFQAYDFGSKENQNRYGQKNPPLYDLANAKSSYAFFYSKNDFFANLKDVQTLFDNVHNPLGKFLIPWDQFNHLDYLWAIDVYELCYKNVLDLLDRAG